MMPPRQLSRAPPAPARSKSPRYRVPNPPRHFTDRPLGETLEVTQGSLVCVQRSRSEIARRAGLCWWRCIVAVSMGGGTVSGSQFLDRGKFTGKGLPGNPPFIFWGGPADSKEDLIPSWIARQSLTPPGSANPVTYSVHGAEVKK